MEKIWEKLPYKWVYRSELGCDRGKAIVFSPGTNYKIDKIRYILPYFLGVPLYYKCLSI